MSDANVPAGWYPAAHASGEQRYWDGAKWLDWTPEQAAAAASIPAAADNQDPSGSVSAGSAGDTAAHTENAAIPATPAATPASYAEATSVYPPAAVFSSGGKTTGPRTIAILALCVGIGAFLTGWVPVVGLILAVTAVILGIVALVKGQPRGFALTGLILGAIALIASLVFTISFLSFVNTNASTSGDRAVPDVTTTPEGPNPVESEEAVEPEPEPEPEQPVVPDPASFGVVDERTFALIAKEPDAHIGTNLIVYGTVNQLDSATGPCNMLLGAAEAQKENSFDYGQNTLATSGDGDNSCPVFDPLVEGDHVKMWVTVLGSYSYETQIGGNTTVPAFEAWQAELLPPQEF